MRSEKEIREVIESIKKHCALEGDEAEFLGFQDLEKKQPVCFIIKKQSIVELEKLRSASEELALLEWVLEGEPRYSVKELQKILVRWWTACISPCIVAGKPPGKHHLLALERILRDSKGVKEMVEEKP